MSRSTFYRHQAASSALGIHTDELQRLENDAMNVDAVDDSDFSSFSTQQVDSSASTEYTEGDTEADVTQLQPSERRLESESSERRPESESSERWPESDLESSERQSESSRGWSESASISISRIGVDEVGLLTRVEAEYHKPARVEDGRFINPGRPSGLQIWPPSPVPGTGICIEGPSSRVYANRSRGLRTRGDEGSSPPSSSSSSNSTQSMSRERE